MPKARVDRQLPWILGLSKIERATLEVIPVYRRSSFFVPTRNESRWPDLHSGVVKGPDNRMGIPAGSLLDKQFVPLGVKSPLNKRIFEESFRAAWQIFYRDGHYHLPILAVVGGLAVAQRRRVHILANYQNDLQSLYESVTLVRGRLEDSLVRLTAQQQRTMLAALGQYQLRIEDIQAILSDRAAREVGLKLAFQTAQSRLVEMGANLKKISGSARADQRPSLVRVRAIANAYADELTFFNTREIRPLTRSVRSWCRLLAKVEGRYIGANLADRIDLVADRLLEAALQLQLQAEDIDPLELTAARQLELVGA